MSLVAEQSISNEDITGWKVALNEIHAALEGRYTPGDKLQQRVAATRRSDKSLRVCWRILVKIFVSAT